ncbi:hypothetical protein [Actinomadura sp. 3N407]|uniref:hypothetical protein n=1 Tax=Actinomadura sp. 3N407 TaxID=3457423 RepID=UPI003FCE7491
MAEAQRTGRGIALGAKIEGAGGFPHGVLRGTQLWDAAWNSLRIVGLAALICGFFGLLIGYVVVRGAGSRVSSFLRQVSFLHYLVPGIAFAAASLSLFAVRLRQDDHPAHDRRTGAAHPG